MGYLFLFLFFLLSVGCDDMGEKFDSDLEFDSDLVRAFQASQMGVPTDAVGVKTHKETIWESLAAGGNIGRTVEVESGGGMSALPPVTPILSIQTHDSAAQTLTVELQRFENIPFASPQKPGIPELLTALPGATFFARIQWGVGGFVKTAFVDFGAGKVFNLNASFVRIDAIPIPESTVAGTIRLGASISPGNHGGGGGPQLTMFPGSVPDGTISGKLPIPPFAYRLYMLSNNAQQVSRVSFWDRNLVLISEIDTDNLSQSNRYKADDGMIIPNNARAFSVENSTGVVVRYIAVFDINLQ